MVEFDVPSVNACPIPARISDAHAGILHDGRRSVRARPLARERDHGIGELSWTIKSDIVSGVELDETSVTQGRHHAPRNIGREHVRPRPSHHEHRTADRT